MENLQIRVPIDDNNFLVAEAGGDLCYKEIYIGLENSKGEWINIAVIGESYRLDDKASLIPIKGEYTVKVFDPEKDCDIKSVITLKVPEGGEI